MANLLFSWVLWREIACRMGVKYIPKTLEQALEWRTVCSPGSI